jgi:hypothetical protein
MTVHVIFPQTSQTSVIPDSGPIPERSLVSRMAMLGTTLAEFRAPRRRRERGKGELSMRAFLSRMTGVVLAASAVAFGGHTALSAAPPEPLAAVSEAPAAPVAPAPAIRRPAGSHAGDAGPGPGAGAVPLQLPRLRAGTESIYDGPFERDAQGALWVARGTFALEERVQLVLEDVLEVVVRDDLEGERYLRMRDGALVKAWPELLEAFESLRYRKEYAAASGRGQASPLEPDTVELTDAQRKARDEASARALVEQGVVLPHGAPAPAPQPTTK